MQSTFTCKFTLFGVFITPRGLLQDVVNFGFGIWLVNSNLLCLKIRWYQAPWYLRISPKLCSHTLISPAASQELPSTMFQRSVAAFPLSPEEFFGHRMSNDTWPLFNRLLMSYWIGVGRKLTKGQRRSYQTPSILISDAATLADFLFLSLK